MLSTTLTTTSPLSLLLPLLLLLSSPLVLSTPLPSITTITTTSNNTTTPYPHLPLPNHQHRRLPTELAPSPNTTKANFKPSAPTYINTTVIPQDTYTCYRGSASAFPPPSAWIPLADMWAANQWVLTAGCAWFGVSENSAAQVAALWEGVVSVAGQSEVDARFILAVVLQESNGCVNVPSTNNGFENTGIMQSFEGVTFVGDWADADVQAASIRQMLVDGTQGTATGFGLVQGLDEYGNIYEAARKYNSGSVDQDNLSNPLGATASYVVDVANRMTGWVDAPRVDC